MPSMRRVEPGALVAEIQQLSGEVEQRLTRIFELSDTLYSSVRHGSFRQDRERLEADLQLVQARLDRAIARGEAHDYLIQLQNTVRELERQREAHIEVVPVYVMYANSWKRFAGSMHQGLRRASSTNRLIAQVQQKYGNSAETHAATPPPPPSRAASAVDDLVELYGEETINGG